jgi:hypothetical protein
MRPTDLSGMLCAAEDQRRVAAAAAGSTGTNRAGCRSVKEMLAARALLFPVVQSVLHDEHTYS